MTGDMHSVTAWKSRVIEISFVDGVENLEIRLPALKSIIDLEGSFVLVSAVTGLRQFRASARLYGD